MNQFKVGKKYKFNEAMTIEFVDAHFSNEEILNEITTFDNIITVDHIEDNLVRYKGKYCLYESDVKFFIELHSESDVVKAWFDKLNWLDRNTPIATFGGFLSNEIDEMNDLSDCIDFVINSYDAYQNKAKQKEKQELVDKKKALEVELAEINKQLGEDV
jgi:hypothetical protein